MERVLLRIWYCSDDAGLRRFLDKKLYPREMTYLPDYSQDETKWPEHWKKGKE